jgi:hypothetical protein
MLDFKVFPIFLSGCFLLFVHCHWFGLPLNTVDCKSDIEPPFEHFYCALIPLAKFCFVKKMVEGGNICVNVPFCHGEFFKLCKCQFH